MAPLLGILALLAVYGGPVVLGAWAGGRSRIPWQAFVLGDIITPLSALLLGLALETIAYSMDPGKSGGGLLVIVLPMVGVLTGFISGTIACFVSSQRRQREAMAASAPTEPNPPDQQL